MSLRYKFFEIHSLYSCLSQAICFSDTFPKQRNSEFNSHFYIQTMKDDENINYVTVFFKAIVTVSLTEVKKFLSDAYPSEVQKIFFTLMQQDNFYCSLLPFTLTVAKEYFDVNAVNAFSYFMLLMVHLLSKTV